MLPFYLTILLSLLSLAHGQSNTTQTTDLTTPQGQTDAFLVCLGQNEQRRANREAVTRLFTQQPLDERDPSQFARTVNLEDLGFTRWNQEVKRNTVLRCTSAIGRQVKQAKDRRKQDGPPPQPNGQAPPPTNNVPPDGQPPAQPSTKQPQSPATDPKNPGPDPAAPNNPKSPSPNSQQPGMTPSPTTTPSQCTKKLQRREWRSLSRDDKKKFFAANRCLMRKPSRSGDSRFNAREDLAVWHGTQQTHLHFLAAFLPAHRRFVQVMEKDLNDCGWDQGMPYIDWQLDADDLNKSLIFDNDSEVGLGGDGSEVNSRACPYSNWKLVTGGAMARALFSVQSSEQISGRQITSIGLCRNFNNADAAHPGPFGDKVQPFLRKSFIDALFDTHARNFYSFSSAIEASLHGIIHSAIGGAFSKNFYTPNDALFGMHHSFVDMLFLRWQNLRQENRMAYNGPTRQQLRGAAMVNNATLNDGLDFSLFGLGTIKIRDMINPDNLCVEYV